MADLFVYLVIIPLIYTVGMFYWRLGRRLRLAASRAMQGAAPAAGFAYVQQDRMDETAALATARAIVAQFDEQPDMQRDERLACVTYAILDAMHHLEELRHGGHE